MLSNIIVALLIFYTVTQKERIISDSVETTCFHLVVVILTVVDQLQKFKHCQTYVGSFIKDSVI